ncbi:MAG TPA: hypothetical protein VN453_05420, partial [Feifaniaceae bacterium]|nr:hypothetical protein [Feifaniaceae bacterium]
IHFVLDRLSYIMYTAVEQRRSSRGQIVRRMGAFCVQTGGWPAVYHPKRAPAPPQRKKAAEKSVFSGFAGKRAGINA